MGQIITFPSNGGYASGYLAAPREKGPGVIVIQEWWGLVDHIKDVADRFAAEGFIALAPDLFHGITTKEPDEANKLMMELNIDQAARDMSGAVAYVRGNNMLDPYKVGCVGFCMGGLLSLVLAARGDVDAAVTYYGVPSGQNPQPDFASIKGPVLGHFAEHDDWANRAAVENLVAKLEALGKDVEHYFYPGTEHAFFNDDRPEVHDAEASEQSWKRTIEFFNRHLRV